MREKNGAGRRSGALCEPLTEPHTGYVMLPGMKQRMAVPR